MLTSAEMVQETQDDVYTVLVTVRPIFPDPWWLKLWRLLNKSGRERHSRDLKDIAMPKPPNAVDGKNEHPLAPAAKEASGSQRQPTRISASSASGCPF